MKVALGCDHGGINLKNKIIKHLESKEYEIRDFGTFNDSAVDYPDYGLKVAEAIKNKEVEKGILICGTGIGISISANKVPGIRAAVCTDSYMARMSREHNDTNILSLGERVVGEGVALDIVDTWLATEFLGGRHQRRLDKINDIEIKYYK